MRQHSGYSSATTLVVGVAAIRLDYVGLCPRNFSFEGDLLNAAVLHALVEELEEEEVAYSLDPWVAHCLGELVDATRESKVGL